MRGLKQWMSWTSFVSVTSYSARLPCTSHSTELTTYTRNLSQLTPSSLSTLLLKIAIGLTKVLASSKYKKRSQVQVSGIPLRIKLQLLRCHHIMCNKW